MEQHNSDQPADDNQNHIEPSATADDNDNNGSGGSLTFDHDHDEDDDGEITEWCPDDGFPPGHFFAPTDFELIEHYLKRKINGEPIPSSVNIRDVALYNDDPPHLIGNIKERETEWYFFTPRSKKYPNGKRPNRSTLKGYWKPTGNDISIPDTQGYKKSLDYYTGSHPGGLRTDWKMHEYKFKNDDNNHPITTSASPSDDMMLDEWVLCKVYKKKEKNNNGNEAIASGTTLASANFGEIMEENNRRDEATASGTMPALANVRQNEEEEENNGSRDVAAAPVRQENNGRDEASTNETMPEPAYVGASTTPSMAGHGNSVVYYHNWNGNWNAFQPTDNNAAAYLMPVYDNGGFEYQNRNNATQATANNGASSSSLMVGYNNNNNDVFEDPSWNNASLQPLALNNGDQASTMATGYDEIEFPDDQMIDWINATQPTLYHGPLIHDEEAWVLNSQKESDDPAAAFDMDGQTSAK